MRVSLTRETKRPLNKFHHRRRHAPDDRRRSGRRQAESVPAKARPYVYLPQAPHPRLDTVREVGTRARPETDDLEGLDARGGVPECDRAAAIQHAVGDPVRRHCPAA
jgi:hypothetical protein